MSSIFQSVCCYAIDSWKVFPVYEVNAKGECTCTSNKCSSPGKHPRTPKGLKDATSDLNQINSWWKQWPNANVGVVTGSDSGIVVIDVDAKNGGLESLDKVASMFGDFPKTLTVATGGGGLHLYFRHPGSRLGNKTDVFRSIGLSGIDFRADGGYVVAPPSRHSSGAKYLWKNEEPLAEFNQLPAQVVNFLTGSPVNSPAYRPSSKGDFHDETILEGSRNTSLFNFGRALVNGFRSLDSFQSKLIEENLIRCVPPLPELEVQRLAKNIWSYQWKDAPIPLPDNEMRIPVLTPDLLPKPIEVFVLDAAERMQVPSEMIAIPLIIGFGSLMGTRHAVQPKKNDSSFRVRANIWGIIVAEPSSLKSPSAKLALEGLQSIQKVEFGKYQLALEIHEQKKTEIESRKRKLEKDLRGKKLSNAEKSNAKRELQELVDKPLPQAPQPKRLIANDSTSQALVEIFRSNPQGILLYRDELAGFLETLDKPGNEGDRQFYLETWDGDGQYIQDRIGRGSVYASRICLSVFGTTQPHKLKQMFEAVLTNGSSAEDGMLARFQLLVQPLVPRVYRHTDRAFNKVAKNQVLLMMQRIHENQREFYSDQFVIEEDTRIFKFCDHAQAVYNTWITALENRLRKNDSSSPALQAHIGKYRSLMPKLAMIFHVLMDSIPVSPWISIEATQLAVKWCEYLEKHATGIYYMASPEAQSLASAKALLAKIRSGKVRHGDTLRSIYRNQWSGLRRDQLDRALLVLEEHNCARACELRPTSVGGAPSHIIEIHPDLQIAADQLGFGGKPRRFVSSVGLTGEAQ